LQQLLVPIVLDLSSQQAALKDVRPIFQCFRLLLTWLQQSTAIFSNLVNATEILQGHAQKLAQADSTVSRIHENLDQAAEAVKSWNENLPTGWRLTDLVIRVGTPVGALILGNYGITPTMTMNAVLLISGKLFKM
jgi:hypothetical protein